MLAHFLFGELSTGTALEQGEKVIDRGDGNNNPTFRIRTRSKVCEHAHFILA